MSLQNSNDAIHGLYPAYIRRYRTREGERSDGWMDGWMGVYDVPQLIFYDRNAGWNSIDILGSDRIAAAGPCFRNGRFLHFFCQLILGLRCNLCAHFLISCQLTHASAYFLFLWRTSLSRNVTFHNFNCASSNRPAVWNRSRFTLSCTRFYLLRSADVYLSCV